MLAGQMDVGSGGVGPFIQAIDKGLDWKALGAMNEMPLYLNCARADIKTLKDVKPGDRIAMPAIGSMQHVVEPGSIRAHPGGDARVELLCTARIDVNAADDVVGIV